MFDSYIINNCLAEFITNQEEISVTSLLKKIALRNNISVNDVHRILDDNKRRVQPNDLMEYQRKWKKLLNERRIALYPYFSGMIQAFQSDETVDNFLKRYAFENHLVTNKFRKYAKLYYEKYATFDEQKLYKLTVLDTTYRRSSEGNKRYDGYRLIIDIVENNALSDKEKVNRLVNLDIDVIKASELQLESYFNGLNMRAQTIDEKEKILNLKKNIFLYIEKALILRKSIQKQAATERLTESALENRKSKIYDASLVITYYLESGLVSIQDYINRIHISNNTFYSFLRIVEEFNPSLYRDYMAYRAFKVPEMIDNLNTLGNIVGTYVRDGIDDGNGNLKEFDLLDYYSLADDYPLTKLTRFISHNQHMDQELYRYFITFARSNKETAINLQALFSCQETVVVNDERRAFTNIEKEGILAMLEENNIPVSSSSYEVAKRRYLRKELFIPVVKTEK